jgi:hypothetical protein
MFEIFPVYICWFPPFCEILCSYCSVAGDYIAWNVGRVDWYIITEVAVFRTTLIFSVKQSNDF